MLRSVYIGLNFPRWSRNALSQWRKALTIYISRWFSALLHWYDMLHILKLQFWHICHRSEIQWIDEFNIICNSCYYYYDKHQPTGLDNIMRFTFIQSANSPHKLLCSETMKIMKNDTLQAIKSNERWICSYDILHYVSRKYLCLLLLLLLLLLWLLNIQMTIRETVNDIHNKTAKNAPSEL